MENNNGAYDLEGVLWHTHSNELMKKILELWPDKTIPVIDLGCGMNYYCSVLNYAGYKAVGVDGTNLKAVDVVADITDQSLKSMWTIPEGKCNIISLEVGEHIPLALSDLYLNNLTCFGGDIIMSWAIPGQAGIGHINCQSNDWVFVEMNRRGYTLDNYKTMGLRECVKNCHCNWLKKTLLYFKPKK